MPHDIAYQQIPFFSVQQYKKKNFKRILQQVCSMIVFQGASFFVWVIIIAIALIKGSEVRTCACHSLTAVFNSYHCSITCYFIFRGKFIASCWITCTQVFEVSAAAYIAGDPSCIPVMNHRFVRAEPQIYIKKMQLTLLAIKF